MKSHNQSVINLVSILRRWFGLSAQPEPTPARAVADDPVSEVNLEAPVTHTANDSHAARSPYDPELLDRARMQWQFGDWESLVKLDLHNLEHHPERAKLALVVASAWQQLNDHTAARRFVKLAKQWGCDKKLMAQILIAGVHNTLGRGAFVTGEESRAQAHFQLSVKGGGGDERLAWHAKLMSETRLVQSQISAAAPVPNPVEIANRLGVLNLDTTLHETDEPPTSVFSAGIVSYAQNFEDVMLWRALGYIENGFYIDIGAQDPIVDSVSKAFYEHGWRGIHVEPIPTYAEALRKDRPDETVIQAAISDQGETLTFFEILDTGLSTGDAATARSHAASGFPVNEIIVPCKTLCEILAAAGGRDIHWLKIDVEGMENKVLSSWGESTARPWIVVVESTLPNTQIERRHIWEGHLLKRGYRNVYFDGLNRFYLDANKMTFIESFSCGPNIFDGFKLSRSAPYTIGAPT